MKVEVIDSKPKNDKPFPKLMKHTVINIVDQTVYYQAKHGGGYCQMTITKDMLEEVAPEFIGGGIGSATATQIAKCIEKYHAKKCMYITAKEVVKPKEKAHPQEWIRRLSPQGYTFI